MAFENFPYTNFHEINLDWIVAKVKEAYSASNPPDYPVKSVNGMTGDVIIAIPANLVQSVNGETGDVILYRNPLVQFPTTDEQRWNLFRICDGDERGIEFDEDGAHRIEGTRRILIYDEENQPDFPVTSVNGQTGDVRITAGVNSVNGKTGNVVTPFVNPNSDILKLDSNSNTILWGLSRDVAGGEIALYITRGTGSPQAYIRYTPTDGQAINLPLLSSADIPSESGVFSVNGESGVVTLYGTDILTAIDSSSTITSALQAEQTARENEQTDIIYNVDTLKNSLYSASPITEWNTSWNQAYVNPSNANYIANENYIRTARLGMPNSAYIKCDGDLYFAIFAYDTNLNYAGMLKLPEETFDRSGNYNTNRYQMVSFANLKQKYPGYYIQLVAFRDPLTTMSRADAANILEYTPIANPDISELENTVNTHSQQISALQAADTTHDQQISALQNTDSTHDQQISALQAADAGYNQQISALQTNDATQDQQISALQTGQATQDQQISELYTRTGVYVISISNANTLPLRYPASGTDEKIKDTNKVVSMDLSIPGVQMTDWTITTYNGYLEITGTINGVSNITLYLA